MARIAPTDRISRSPPESACFWADRIPTKSHSNPSRYIIYRRYEENAMKWTFLTLLLVAVTPLLAQTGAKNGEWPTYGGDLGNTRYSALDQINASNFDKLEVAWRFKTDNLGPRPEANLEGTPLMVKGVLYSTAGTRRSVVALDAATGEILWVHGENEGKRGEAAPRQLSGRGLAYWTDGREERIIYVTPGY